MIRIGHSLHSFLRAEAELVRAGGDTRLRPVMHLVVAAWVGLVGLAPRGLAVALWLVVIAENVLGVVFLRILGFRLETAVAAGFIMLFSAGDVATIHAHQYNDLMFANLFVLVTLSLALRPNPVSSWALIPLVLLGFLSHESGAMVGPLLVACDLFREGLPGLARLRSDSRRSVVLGLCIAFVSWRLLTLTPSRHHMFGPDSLVANLSFLLSSTENVTRNPFLIVGTLYVVLRRWSGWPGGSWRLLAFALAWPLLAYTPYLLNRSYQSTTYLNLALLVPAAALVEPWVSWFFSKERSLSVQRVTPALFVLLICPTDVAKHLNEVHRFDGPLIEQIVRHVRASTALQDVWLVELNEQKTWVGSSPVADQILLTSMDDSMAVSESVPGRVVHVHDVDPDVFQFVHLRPDDLAIAVWTVSGQTALGLLPHDGSPPEQFFPTTPVPAPAGIVKAAPVPKEHDLQDAFWKAYAERRDVAMVDLLEQIDRLSGSEGGAAQADWVRAVHAAAPKLGPDS